MPTPQWSTRNSVKGALIFSAILAAVAGVMTTIVATGGFAGHSSAGESRVIRLDLGLIAFGITFIASLVICALLAMSYRENPEHLGAGSGINLRSADRLRPPAAPPAEPTSSHPPPAGTEPTDDPTVTEASPEPQQGENDAPPASPQRPQGEPPNR